MFLQIKVYIAKTSVEEKNFRMTGYNKVNGHKPIYLIE
jgi:hypothetical protein